MQISKINPINFKKSQPYYEYGNQRYINTHYQPEKPSPNKPLLALGFGVGSILIAFLYKRKRV